MTGRDFPPGFLWGASTASYQVEGGITNNDWYRWERAGRAVEPCGPAIEHWRRWREDYALLGELGHTAHRMSVEWSRLEPEPGRFDDDAFAHYAEMLDTLAGSGIVAMTTLQHFTLPAWFADRGGWLAPDAVEVFARYAAEVGRRLGSRVPLLATINEPQMVAVNGHWSGRHPPGRTDPAEAEQVNAVLMRAHRAAVARLREVAPRAEVGVCLQLPVVAPADPADPAAVAAADRVRRLLVDVHLEDLAAGGDVGDWLGVQYYTRARVDADGRMVPPGPEVETTAMGWEVYPAGFGEVLRAAARVGLPLYVTENGVATDDDAQRRRYLRSHLEQVAQVLAEGVDVRGYLHWSAFDNFEWAVGYRPRFGLVAVDREHGMTRTPRDSAWMLREVIRSGRVPDLPR